MSKKNDSSYRAGNTEELDRLEKEVERLKDVQEKILVQKRELEERVAAQNLESGKLRESLKTAYEKIKIIESLEKPAETMRRGYVEIATLPFSGMVPPPSVVDGIQVPRRRDDEGVVYEVLPVENAIRLMTDGSSFKRYLVGPSEVYKIEGEAFFGMFKKQVSFKKHRKDVLPDGTVEFIMVEIEESIEKVE